MDLGVVSDKIGHRFADPDLLRRALTHRSHGAAHNERLEYLGDSVVNCIIALELYTRFPDLSEGDLSRLRANLVNQKALHRIALDLGLGEHLLLGEGEIRSGGAQRPSILADAVEAMMGAALLDGGFEAAGRAVRRLFAGSLAAVNPDASGKDAKTLLQEFLQGKKIQLPQYNVVATHGAAHNQEFEIECLVPKLDIHVFGTGGSRRAGEQAAAKLALESVQQALAKAPVVPKKTRQRTTQLKLAGIATFQPDAPAETEKIADAKKSARPEAAAGSGKSAKISATRDQDSLPLDGDESKPVSANQSKSA